MREDAEKRCWLALAIPAEKLARGLAALNGERRLTRIYPHAAVLHLYRDGRMERIPAVQLEMILPPDRVPELLKRLEAAAAFDPAFGGGALIRALPAARHADCIVLPAPASAPFAQIVRWRGPQSPG